MTTYTYTIGRAADKTAGMCDFTPLDLWRRRHAGLFASGSTIIGNWLPGLWTGQDVCVPCRDYNLIMNAPWGLVTLDASPIAPRTSSLLFPNDHDYNGSWGNKGIIIFGDGNLTINGPFHLKNATAGPAPNNSYGNVAGIRKTVFTTGATPHGSLRLYGVTFSGCDDGILADAEPGLGDIVVIDDDCNFHDCGGGTGQTHNIYIGPFEIGRAHV